MDTRGITTIVFCFRELRMGEKQLTISNWPLAFRLLALGRFTHATSLSKERRVRQLH